MRPVAGYASPKYTFDVFVRDRRRGTTRLISRGFDGRLANRTSTTAEISGNGRYVAFSSSASNLVRNDTNRKHDVFLYDRKVHKIVWSTVNATRGREGFVYHWQAFGSSMSADGRYIAFGSNVPNLVAGDTNGRHDIFVRDRRAGTTTRVSVASGGGDACAGPVPGGDTPCHKGMLLSPDGRFVAFSSAAPDLVPGDTNRVNDIFVHDIRTLITTRVSVGSSGEEICCISGPSGISTGGRFLVFDSGAANVISGDTNRAQDVFVRGPFNYPASARMGVLR
jgi:Tol biopolymer transport system component